MNDHVTKPLDPEDLFNVLVSCIEPKQKPMIKDLSPKAQKKIQKAKKIVLPGLPGIDTVAVLARVGGKPDALVRLLKKFGTRHAEAVANISAFLNSGKIRKAQEAAHALKGVSGNIGAVELHQAVAKLEMAIKEKQSEEWPPLVDLAHQLLEQVLDSIRKIDPVTVDGDSYTSEAVVPRSADVKKIASTLSELKSNLENNSFDSGKKIEVLASMLQGTHLQNEVANLKNLVDQYRFKAALKAVDNLSEVLGRNKLGE